MTTLKRRLLYYGIGFGVGLIFVFFFFSNRGCSWLPENRIKDLLAQNIIFVSEQNSEVLDKLKIDKSEIKKYIADADVYFSKSVKNTNPRIYHLEGPTLNNKNFVSQIIIYDGAFVCELVPNKFNSETTKPTNIGLGIPVVMPKEKNFFYSDSSEYTICRRKALGIVEDSTLMSKFLSSGRIDLNNSRLKLKPKPEHRLTIQGDNGVSVGFKASFYKEKARIFLFEYEGKDCD
jgi:hypothetical protein